MRSRKEEDSMPNKDDVIFEIEVSYVLKFIDYERISSIPHGCFSTRVKVQVVRGRRGTRIIHEFISNFLKDEKKWVVSWRSNSILEQTFQSRAVTILNRRFPDGVVRFTDSAAA